MLWFKQGFEAEVLLMVEISLYVGSGHFTMMHAQCLGGHQLHEPLAQVSDKPVSQDRHHQASIDRDIFGHHLGGLGLVENTQGLCHR